mmetsp:Transcript_14114/g.23487  ORF Transcript_14114/g.23487 Transcript_14114/m.23487 type:complete len:360 (-) Transcript_14114:253-1332(-)
MSAPDNGQDVEFKNTITSNPMNGDNSDLESQASNSESKPKESTLQVAEDPKSKIPVPLEPEDNASYRRGKNKVTTLEKALVAAENIDNCRMRRILRQFNDEESQESKKRAIIAFKAATDPSYLIQSTMEEIWTAVMRREAWAQRFWTMAFTAVAQVVLCFIALLAYNAPVNTSTLVMACIYTVVMATVNPFDMTFDLVGIIEKEGRKIAKKNGWPLAFFVLFLSIPVLVVFFSVTIVFDFLVGKVLDCSYGSLINTVIDAIVKSTSISVGLRSSNPINAIQTFVGFDFISSMDEVIIESIDIDMSAMTSMGNATPNWNQSKRSKMTRVRITLYIVIPLIVGFFTYTTAYNVCWVFCDNQ